MADRSSRWWLAALITTMNVVAFTRLVGGASPAWAAVPWIRCSLVLSLILSTALTSVFWLYVGFDFGFCRFDERGRPVSASVVPPMSREDSSHV